MAGFILSVVLQNRGASLVKICKGGMAGDVFLGDADQEEGSRWLEVGTGPAEPDLELSQR
jgi:hypothetical protein